MKISEMTVKINIDDSQLNESAEKANQLKSLLQEVKELATSLALNVTFGCKEA
jgi:hypothetical protein